MTQNLDKLINTTNNATNKWPLYVVRGFSLANLVLYVLLSYISFSYAAQDWVRIKSSVDKNKITLGDRFKLTLIVEYEPKIKINFPPPATELGAFEIKDYKIVGPKKRGWLFGKKTMWIEHQYILTTYTTGEYKVPSIKIQFVAEQGELKEIQSPEISVFVASVKPKPGEKDDIRDIKPPVSVAGSKLLLFLIAILPLLLAAWLAGYEYYLYRQNKNIFAESGPPRPADELAYERLAKLQELQLIQQNKIKEYYIMLSDIIRHYIEGRYQVTAMELTTYEVYLVLRNVEKKYCSLIKEFLEDCDMVKFAKYNPDLGKIDDNYNTAKKIVDLTKQIVVDKIEDIENPKS